MDPDTEAYQAARQHIFAVNHESAFLDVVRMLLQDERYNVTTTNYVPRTWDQIAVLQPNLLLIDLVPGLQAGWDLLERLRAESVTGRIPVLVTSSDRHLLARVQVERERYGGDRVIIKPLNTGVLLETIRTLIGPA